MNENPDVDAILNKIISFAETQIELANDKLGLLNSNDPDYDVLIQIKKDMHKLIADQLWTQGLYKDGMI